jgi:hypothetical protein
MIAGFHGAVPADVCLGAQRFAVVVGICQLRGNTKPGLYSLLQVG